MELGMTCPHAYTHFRHAVSQTTHRQDMKPTDLLLKNDSSATVHYPLLWSLGKVSAYTYAYMYTYGHLWCHLRAQEGYLIPLSGANELNCVKGLGQV